MRLADFILANVEPILRDWEAFAQNTSAGGTMDKLALRDHAEDILRATARDLVSKQSDQQQSDKSKGLGSPGATSRRLTNASEVHGVGRVGSGFDLPEVVSEYRAMRASVVRLWRESEPEPDVRDLDDLTRFNESIDQSLTDAVRSYTDRVNRSRQMFLAILGHDLRNPLNSIMMSAELVRQTGNPNPDASDAVSRISASAAAIARLVSDLLDFAGTGLGAAMPLTRAPLDLGLLCREVFEEYRAANPKRALEFQPSGDLAGAWDASRLRQMVSNLLGNALQHGATDVPVGLSIRDDGSSIVLAVRNAGPPIPPDVLPTLFDPLVRSAKLGSAAQRTAGSIGLGLYIAREVAIAHGGTIDVKSTEADGTVFTVHLPRK